ncbi:MAG: hypothetical protein EZS28_028172 [Streblomastix strix]|uniref:Uncharacterized protein n=1 Tax=Streblomastix strix TaxID=222440 RepID=A0A5J4V1Q8_9EUKA|nr:MAG: hypothetical protein EZS28_028172 [Streblomastix strix]
MSGSHQYVEVQYSSSVTMTRLLDLYPYDRPEHILLTTFQRQIRIYSQQELEECDMNPFIGLSPYAQNADQTSQYEGEEYNIHRRYLRNDGAMLMIAGHNGQLSTSILPLTAILDFPPGQPKQGKKLSTAQFFFPSLITSMKLFAQSVKIVEDEGIVYLYGDRAYALTWSDKGCKVIWTDLDYNNIIHSLIPMRVTDEKPSLQYKDDDDCNELSDSNSQSQSQSSLEGVGTHKTEIPHPTLVWIDYVDRKLTFGTIDKRSVLTRQIKDLPSIPLAIAHIPTLHAIAVLCQEYTKYTLTNQVQPENIDFDINNFYKQDQKRQNLSKLKEKGTQYYLNRENYTSFAGLGLDILFIGEKENSRRSINNII